MEREKLGSRLGFILLSAGCAIGGSRLGFMLRSAGCAIGIGNVGKVPWLAGQ